MRDYKLPSGAVLKVAPSPFAPAWALYQSLLGELKSITVTKEPDVAALFKDLFCHGFTSPEVERCLWVCFGRCIYSDKRGDLKIDKDTFEPVETRQDFMDVCMEVARENVLPFVSSLYAEYKKFTSMSLNTPKSS